MATIDKLFGVLLNDPKIRTVTKFLSPTATIKLTRRFKGNKEGTSKTYILTVGKPNYAERKFIADCKKAGERFPVRKIQLKFWPKKKGAK